MYRLLRKIQQACPVRSRSSQTIEDSNRGFSVLEILIAMAILILAISAVILVSFGNQSVLSDSQTSTEGLNKAQGLLEQEQSLARKDFNLVNAKPLTTLTDASGWTYSTKVDVINPVDSVTSKPDYFTKQVTATVSWTGDHNRAQNASLSALVTNFNNANGGDTCNSSLSGDWSRPKILNNANTNFASLVNDASGVYPITDLDAYKGKLYVTTNNSSLSQPTFFIFDISNPASPTLGHGGADKIDNDVNNTGLNAVAVADYVKADGTKHVYAYVASASSFVRGQLQVIDVGVSPPVLVNTYKIDVSIVSGSGAGNSIFYKDGYIYLGLANVGGGPEFNIIDVHDPLNPVRRGGAVVTGDVNAIYAKGNYAYVATPNSQELKVYDVSDPSNPLFKGGFDAPGGSGNGKAIYGIGDTLYLGRTLGGKEFYVLNNSNPAALTANNSAPPAQDITVSVDGVIARDNLSFLLTKTNFQVWKLDQTVSPWVISQWSPSFLPLPYSGNIVEPSLDCEGNNFYAGSNDISGHGSLSVISPGP